MDLQAIYRGLEAAFADVFDDEVAPLRPEMTAKDVADWDSVTHINLLLAIEAQFGLKFSAKDIDGLRNVGDLAALVARRTGGSA